VSFVSSFFPVRHFACIVENKKYLNIFLLKQNSSSLAHLSFELCVQIVHILYISCCKQNNCKKAIFFSRIKTECTTKKCVNSIANCSIFLIINNMHVILQVCIFFICFCIYTNGTYINICTCTKLPAKSLRSLIEIYYMK